MVNYLSHASTKVVNIASLFLDQSSSLMLPARLSKYSERMEASLSSSSTFPRFSQDFPRDDFIFFSFSHLKQSL